MPPLPNQSAVAFVTIKVIYVVQLFNNAEVAIGLQETERTIDGKMYVTRPVSSNMITTTDTKL